MFLLSFSISTAFASISIMFHRLLIIFIDFQYILIGLASMFVDVRLLLSFVIDFHRLFYRFPRFALILHWSFMIFNWFSLLWHCLELASLMFINVHRCLLIVIDVSSIFNVVQRFSLIWNRFLWFSIRCHCFCTDFRRCLLNFRICVLIFIDSHFVALNFTDCHSMFVDSHSIVNDY